MSVLDANCDADVDAREAMGGFGLNRTEGRKGQESTQIAKQPERQGCSYPPYEFYGSGHYYFDVGFLDPKPKPETLNPKPES